MSKLIVRDDAEVLHDVRGLVNIFDDNSYQEKIRDAVGGLKLTSIRKRRKPMADAKPSELVCLKTSVRRLT